MAKLRLGFASAVLVLISGSTRGETTISVLLRIEPPQAVRAVVLNAGGHVVACPVRDGSLLVPANVPMPWTVAQLRFEPATYTARDLERKAPLVLRELGTLSIRFRPAPSPSEPVRAWVLRNGEHVPEEVPLLHRDGAFRASLASGTYAGAFFTDSRGTRIRSGIVLAPGKVTELGDTALEPTGAISLRVLDGVSRRPVAGARVTWAPPAALNSQVARHLFSRAWSATTDRTGVASLRSIGPPPIPAQWTVEAAGYAPSITRQVFLKDPSRTVVPDTLLRAESVVTIEVQLPRGAEEFRGATLVASSPEDDDSPRYEPFLRQPLREDGNEMKLSRFGRIRFSIDSADGRKLLFHDVELSPDDTRVVLAPMATEISGVVRRQDLPVAGVIVTVADRRDARMIVGRATTGTDGRYAISTYQSGEVLVYTNGPYKDRSSSTSAMQSPVLRTLRLSGQDVRLDIQLPASAATITVLDAESRKPLRATVLGSLTDRSGRSESLYLETDEHGTATVAGAREGTAKGFVRAKGYRGREVTFDVGEAQPEITVSLTPGGTITGRVVDPAGAAVPGARILGGYPAPLAMQAHFKAITDASGRFEIDGAPTQGTSFYVVASGYALAIAVLDEENDKVIRLAPPNAGALRLVAGHGPPKKLSMFLAAPRGGAIIPYGVFHELGQVNGLSSYQLNSISADGTLILPEFLSPGSYSLYRVRPTGKAFAEAFDPVAELRVPATAGSVVTIPE